VKKAAIQEALDGLAHESGLRMVVDDVAYPVSGIRALEDGLIEVYPLDDPDERTHRFEVSKVSKVDNGVEFESPNHVVLRFFPLGDLDIAGRVVPIKDDPYTTEEDDE
jgi:hypothetical protein